MFGLDANTGQVARYHLPSPFYRDFSLLFQVQPTSDKAGVLFAITDASQSIIYVGVKLSEVKDGKQQIIFYYTEPGSQNSYPAATFTVNSLVNQWTRFAISVEEEEVVLHMDCEEFERVHFERSPDEMELEDGSGLFVAQAGGADPDKYQVSMTNTKGLYFQWKDDYKLMFVHSGPKKNVVCFREGKLVVVNKAKIVNDMTLGLQIISTWEHSS